VLTIHSLSRTFPTLLYRAVTSDDQLEELAPEHQKTAAAVLERKFPEAARLLRAARMEYDYYQYDKWDGGTVGPTSTGLSSS
jgi:hypothetical protein